MRGRRQELHEFAFACFQNPFNVLLSCDKGMVLDGVCAPLFVHLLFSFSQLQFLSFFPSVFFVLFVCFSFYFIGSSLRNDWRFLFVCGPQVFIDYVDFFSVWCRQPRWLRRKVFFTLFHTSRFFCLSYFPLVCFFLHACLFTVCQF